MTTMNSTLMREAIKGMRYSKVFFSAVPMAEKLFGESKGDIVALDSWSNATTAQEKSDINRQIMPILFSDIYGSDAMDGYFDQAHVELDMATMSPVMFFEEHRWEIVDWVDEYHVWLSNNEGREVHNERCN